MAHAWRTERHSVASARVSGVTLNVGSASDAGRLRNENQDGHATMVLAKVCENTSLPLGLLVVADGMGVHAVGQEASRMCVDTVASELAKRVFLPVLDGEAACSPLFVGQAMKESVSVANITICEAAVAEGSNMGTTVFCAIYSTV